MKSQFLELCNLKDMRIEKLEKANEWHYPSKGEYPKEPKWYLCQIKCNVGSAITLECLDYDVEYNSWKDAYGDVIAWKEIGVVVTDQQGIWKNILL